MRSLLTVLMTSVLVLGCGPMPSLPPVHPQDHPSSEAPVPSPFPSGVVERWMAFRERFGLRADRSWAEAVARDPAAGTDTDVPLLPGELAAVAAAVRSTQGMTDLLQWYGERHPEVYAGVTVEGRTVVLHVAADPFLHETALVAFGARSAAFEVRRVPHSLEALDGFAALVRSKEDLIEASGARLVAADPDVSGLVRVRYLAADDEVGERISELLGNPGWLSLEREGPMPWAGPRGSLVVRLIDAAGRPVPDVQCSWMAVDPTVDAQSALAYSTDERGECRIDHLPATSYSIELFVMLAGTGRVVVGTGHVTVPGDGVERIEMIAGDLPE